MGVGSWVGWVGSGRVGSVRFGSVRFGLGWVGLGWVLLVGWLVGWRERALFQF